MGRGQRGFGLKVGGLKTTLDGMAHGSHQATRRVCMGVPLWVISLLLLLRTAAGAAEANLATNLALGAEVTSSGPVWGGLRLEALTDGDAGTFVHPLDDSGTLGYYFEIDLGRTHNLERIIVRNRNDGCCPGRLSNYVVELYADAGGETGALNWRAIIRADGSDSGSGGIDVVTRTNSASGTFSGRFVRIVNNNNAGYSPQVAEVEVYGGIVPQIRSFYAVSDTIASGQSTFLKWEVTGATSAVLLPGIGPVDQSIGEISVQPQATTTYTLIATNAAGSSSATLTVGVDVQLAAPEISEFLADNQGNLNDEDGDASDWIEIRNPNGFSLNMEGFHLTDDPNLSAQWTFPPVRIPPHGHLIVFASGKNRTVPGAELHTSFRLNNEGEYLALTDRSGTVVQQFPTTFPNPPRFPAQLRNVSYGLGSNNVTGFFRPPTPGLPNGTAYAGVVADTKFSHDRGFYETNFFVTIASGTPDAVIRYTLNRSDITEATGVVYNGPIPIVGTSVLRAAAFKPGWAPTDVDTHTYIFPSNVVSSSVMRTNVTRNPLYAGQIQAGLRDVPSVSIVTPRTISGTAEVKASFEWLPFGAVNEGRTIREDCGVRNFGGAFTTFAKKNFRLYFRGEYGAPKLRYPVFKGVERGLAAAEEFDQLELRGGSHDMVDRGFYMANVFTDDTLLEMGQLNPHGRFVHLYLNGTYWGLYHLRERWGASMHESYLGGARTNYESINGNWNVGGWAEPGTAYDGDGSTWTAIKQQRSNYKSVQALLDVPQYTDYMLMCLFGGAEDEYRCVGPNVPGSGFKFYLNDADGWFCGSWYCAAGNRTARGAPGRQFGDGPGSIFSMLFKEADPDYRTLLADRIYRALFGDGALTPARNAARLNARCAEIQRAFIAESARWNYLSPSTWANRRNEVLTNWLPTRTARVLADLRTAGFYPSLSAPVVNPPAGTTREVAAGYELKFAAPARGAIYYTLDGSDPRLPGGAVSTEAQIFPAGPGASIRIDRSTLVKSRVRDGTQWSALNESFFQVGEAIDAGELVVSELNYDHSRRGTEFIELLNNSPRALNLRGVRFVEGINYTFPTNRETLLASGERIVLVRDLFRFQQQYGREIAVSGIYSGGLSRDGERLTFVAGSNVTSVVSSFTYGTQAPWPESANSSLVLAHPELGVGNPLAWRLSSVAVGTPGGSDSSSFSGTPSDDVDGDGLAALLEYALGTSGRDANSGAEAVHGALDLNGYFTLSFSRRLAADDVILACESSDDLTSWSSAIFLRSEYLSAGISRETWGVPAVGRHAAFLRLTVRAK
jgi:hypothetical protein